MRIAASHEIPDELRGELRRAVRLEWLSIVYLSTVVVLMYAAMGSSQAMKTAWVEDVLSLLPAVAFLIAQRVRRRVPDRRFPFGTYRAVTIAFLVAALALLVMGVGLFADGAVTLWSGERPTIGSVEVFGRTIWQGWLMLAVLVWAVVPAVLLGRAKLGPAERLHDKALFADAQMNKADWLTGLATMIGVVGIAAGWWWIDAVAAMFISFTVAHDGARNLTAAVSDLMDAAPRTVDREEEIDLPERIDGALRRLPWVADAATRLRENGHVFFGDVQVVSKEPGDPVARVRQCRDAAYAIDWRLHDLVVQFTDAIETSERRVLDEEGV